METKSLPLNKLFFAAASAVVLIGFIVLTDPRQVALPFIILPFVLIGNILYQLLAAIFLLKASNGNKYLNKIIPLSVSFIGVGLLLLQSLHQLTWRDTVLVLVFTLLLWLYIGRADFLRK